MQTAMSIYGLKQASRSWNIHFDEVVKGFSFIQSKEESCVYKKASGSSVQFLILYVDDILLIGNDIHMLEAAKTSLKNSFLMKDLGEVPYILGIKIYRDRSKSLIRLSQDTVANMASYAISSSSILVIHDNMIIGTNHIVLACLCRHF
jgi:hypothetical protein